MVVLAGISGDRDGPSAAVVDAVATGGVGLAISDDRPSELVRVAGYEQVEELIGRPVGALEGA